MGDALFNRVEAPTEENEKERSRTNKTNNRERRNTNRESSKKRKNDTIMNSPEFYCYDYALHALNSTSALLSTHSAALSVSYTYIYIYIY